MATVGPISPTGSPLTGTLREVPFSSVLQTVAQECRRGILQITGELAGVICFEAGQIYLATSNSGPSLRQLVVGSGVADDDAWQRAVAATAEGRTLVDSLVDESGVDEARLQSVLYEHTVTTVFELLVPSDDEFTFVAEGTHQVGARFRFSVDAVLRDAGERLESFRHIAAALPSTSMVLRMTPTLPENRGDITLTPMQWQVLAAVDGKRTIAEVIAMTGRSAFAVFPALHHLLETGALEKVA